MKKWLLPFAVLCWQTVFAQQSPTNNQARQIFNNAISYLYGTGTSHDPEKAVQLFKQAAAMGDAASLNALGNLYAKGGAGLTADINTAVDYYAKAGAAGYASAYYNLATLFKEGRKLSQDFRQSARYVKSGADLGNDACKRLLAYYYFKGFGIEQNYSAAFDLYKELAESGDANAQYFLGLCYRNGYGTNANQDEARKWLTKAVAKGERQAKHELTNEPKPENSNIFDPGLQLRVEKVKNYQEKLIAEGNNDISGIYKGIAVYYDFSGKHVHEVLPLTLTLRKAEKGYTGTWAESDLQTASIKGSFSSNHFNFDPESRYTRRNYYSYREPEEYQFKTANLSINYLQDSMYLAGDMQFYSISRSEPGQPMYIMLSKKVEASGNFLKSNLQLTLNPNPATDELRVGVTLPSACKVNYEIISVDGKSITNKAGETLLPAGTYYMPVKVQFLARGNYAMRITTSCGATQTKTFIKH